MKQKAVSMKINKIDKPLANLIKMRREKTKINKLKMKKAR
jgi:flagellar biosynthesis chaperone FliJ